jgi:nucleotide-binding universal stress UspA family protein
MFGTIVWATDGSSSADRALPLVRDLGSQAGATVIVLHNVQLMVGRAGGYPVHADEEDLRSKVERQAEELKEAGVAVEIEVVSGGTFGPAHIIAETAERVGADLIVTGTRGHTPVVGLLLGSVVQRLLHIAPCPVLAVPAGNQPAASAAGGAQAVAS